MCILSSPQLLASAFTVTFGPYGAVTRYAQERGLSRQAVYREAAWVQATLDQTATAADGWRQRVQQLEQQLQELQTRLDQTVVLDAERQAAFATVGQARGVSLPDCHALLGVLAPRHLLSVATLGRRTQAAGQRAGELLAVFDVLAQAQTRQVAADEIYVRAPVLMLVEQDSLCWLSGRLQDRVAGSAWAEEFQRLPHLEQVACDGGAALAKGVTLLNAARQAQQQARVVAQGDHYHGLRDGGQGLRQAQRQAEQALAAAEEAQEALEEAGRQGQHTQGRGRQSRAAWQRAEQALDTWSGYEQLWKQVKGAIGLVTPEGELNTRANAERVLVATLPQLPDPSFAKVKRHLRRPELLNYLDHVQQRLAALPYAAEVKEAAVRQEALRRRPELTHGEGARAAALRGILLVGAVVLGKAGAEGTQALAAVRDIVRRAYRASSLVECLNSVLRMQQSRHRKLTQGLLDLKRLYWNSHVFRTGHRRKTSPYQRLGVPWPEGLCWWDVLKLTPEQLRDKLSALKPAA